MMHKLNTKRLITDEGHVETETERPHSIDVAIIFGETGYIITTNDCIHALYKLTEDVEVPVWVDQKNLDGSIKQQPSAAHRLGAYHSSWFSAGLCCLSG